MKASANRYQAGIYRHVAGIRDTWHDTMHKPAGHYVGGVANWAMLADTARQWNAHSPTSPHIQTVARHFLIAAIWADCDEGTHPRATKEAQQAAAQIASEFVRSCGDWFDMAMHAEGYGSHPDAGSPEAAFGHDLYLTLAGHGVGFWDRDELREEAIEMTGPGPSTLGECLTGLCHRSRFRDLSVQFYRGWAYL